MSFTAGIDVGSTYIKAVVLDKERKIVGKAMMNTGFRLAEAASEVFHKAIEMAGIKESDIAYVVSTGYGRYQVPFRDVQVTDLTAQARGARYFFPNTKTVLDVGGQTMKASRLDEKGRVRAFRLNDKCAAGTGAFLEKTARYMGYEIERIGPLIETSEKPVAVSSTCAVFAESEVINHVSEGQTPADIMHGSIVSLVDRCLQLMRRVQMEPEFTLVGGILRFRMMGRVISERLKKGVNVPADDLAQFTAALGAAILAWRRLEKLGNGAQRTTAAAAAA
jgi:(R)-2-hydroxyacyl-CoA dehydratese activating ATPase